MLLILVFSVFASAQEVRFLTKEQARQYIQDAAKDPSLQVSADQQGTVEIKKRTPETVDTEKDLVEEDKNSNWQFMFGLGFNIGANWVTSAVAKQGLNNDTDYHQADLKLGFEAVIRPPNVRMKRWAFGINHSFANGQIGPQPDYYIPRSGKWEGNVDGLVPLDMGSTRSTSYFAEYDILMKPADDPRAAFTIGYHWGRTRTDYNSKSDPYEDYQLYTDHGPQFRLRGLFGGGVAPYVLVKLSNRRQNSFVFGLSVERGPRMKSRPKKTK
jgi:hypothetical protein